jgi:hypothetical protein
VPIERPDGSRVVVIANIRPLTNKRGEITGAINCFYDITERKQDKSAKAAAPGTAYAQAAKAGKSSGKR